MSGKRYVVKSEDGELEFDTLLLVQQAMQQGFVTPEDDLRDGADGRWVKVSQVPALAEATRTRPDRRRWGGDRAWVAVAVALAIAALFALARGFTFVALPLALVVGFILTRVTQRAFKSSADGARNRQGS